MPITVPGILENGVIKMSEVPEGISFSKVLTDPELRVSSTLLPQEESEETWEAMKLSASAFADWDNEVDSVYDEL